MRHLLNHLEDLCFYFGFRLGLCHSFLNFEHFTSSIVVTLHVKGTDSCLGRHDFFLCLDFILRLHLVVTLNNGCGKLHRALHTFNNLFGFHVHFGFLFHLSLFLGLVDLRQLSYLSNINLSAVSLDYTFNGDNRKYNDCSSKDRDHGDDVALGGTLTELIRTIRLVFAFKHEVYPVAVNQINL